MKSAKKSTTKEKKALVPGSRQKVKRKIYEKALRKLQGQLCNLQEWVKNDEILKKKRRSSTPEEDSHSKGKQPAHRKK